ncbi:PREDICTED: uncharacterized protein LOC104608607 isoform X3 [Nelumbo nucifera]|uniref:Uncharacterized protein LOC104608607 isoform X3 n=1 Tax=Nelumbo nucifera TaxID=4432 RepID=A0A1U8AXW0_NELNU|nr:PREDICTED: uncharacterized protein LOC104608607 isoform X3 [Nelumbo nucifera]
MNNNDRVILKERGINMLFVLGGNGTQAGGNAIHNENWFEKKNAKGPYGHITLGDISVHIEQQSKLSRPEGWCQANYCCIQCCLQSNS